MTNDTVRFPLHAHRIPGIVPPPPPPSFNKFDPHLIHAFTPNFMSATPNFLVNFKVINKASQNVGIIEKRPTLALPPVQLSKPSQEFGLPNNKPRLLKGCRVVLYGRDFENLQKDLIETIKEYGGVSYSGICSLKTKSITHLITTENAYNCIPIQTREWLKTTKINVVNEKWLCDTIDKSAVQDENKYPLQANSNTMSNVPSEVPPIAEGPIVEVQRAPSPVKPPPKPKTATQKKKRASPAPAPELQPERKRQREVAPRASAKKFDSRFWATDFNFDDDDDETEEEQEEEEGEVNMDNVNLDEKDEVATYALLDLLLHQFEPSTKNITVKKKTIAPDIDIQTHVPSKKKKKLTLPPNPVKWTVEDTKQWLSENIVADNFTNKLLQEWATKEMIDGEALLELDNMDKLRYTDFVLGIKLKLKKAICSLKENRTL
jgi:hypothetical protein